MNGERWIKNARIVTRNEEFRGAVLIVGGRIAEVSPGSCGLCAACDFEGDFLIPGLVELHTDNLEKHVAPRPKVTWPPIAAVVSHDAAVAAAGITTVFDALSCGEAVDGDVRVRHLDEMVSALVTAHAEQILRADHLLHLRCEVSHPLALDLFSAHVDVPLVRLVSLMDHTPLQRQFTKLDYFETYYKNKWNLDDEGLKRLIARRTENQALYGEKHRRAVVAMARERSLPLASHDDTTEAHVIEAHREGAVISEFPTTVEAARSARRLGLAALAGAPNLVRGASHSGNISALDLASHGLLDVLSSDYVPASLLHGAFLLHSRAGWGLPEAVAAVTARPAELVGLHDRGAVASGLRADLVRVHLREDLPVVRAVWREGRRVC